MKPEPIYLKKGDVMEASTGIEPVYTDMQEL
jgi:hypothetical protein